MNAARLVRALSGCVIRIYSDTGMWRASVRCPGGKVATERFKSEKEALAWAETQALQLRKR